MKLGIVSDLHCNIDGLDRALENEEIRTIIQALGTGIREEFSMEKRRYGKVVIMTDADVDGSHIRTLLLTFFFRHMQELIKRNNIYIAQPPLYGIKKGKSHQYIKNEHEFVKVMVKRAAEGIVIRYGEGAAKLEGSALTKFITVLNEYLGFFDKVNKRLREEKGQRRPRHGRGPARGHARVCAPTIRCDAHSRRAFVRTISRRPERHGGERHTDLLRRDTHGARG